MNAKRVHRFMSAATLAAAAVLTSSAAGQTVINMPVPPRSSAAPRPASAGVDAGVDAAAVVPISAGASEGELALQRYARARSGTSYTYPAASYAAGRRWHHFPLLHGPVIWNRGPFFFGRFHHFGFCR